MEETKTKGVSIVTVTNKPNYMENVFSSYSRQSWSEKELIIILNNDSMNLEEWRKYAQLYQQVTVIQLSEEVSLGSCLNYGVSLAKYEYIAKFDDDDYYGPYFLKEAMNIFEQKKADVVGKRTCFMYTTTTKELRLRFPKNENQRAFILQGGTIMARKEVLRKVPFPKRNVREGLNFLQRCKGRGYRIYSSSRFNFAYIRHGDEKHTWNPSTKYFSRTSKRVGFMDDFTEIVNQDQRAVNSKDQ